MKTLNKLTAVNRLNMRYLIPAYISTTVCILFVVLVKFNHWLFIHGTLYIEPYLSYILIIRYLPIAFLAYFIASQNFSLFLNLGSNRKDFFYGSLLTYIFSAALVSALNCLIYTAFIIINPDIFDGIGNPQIVFVWTPSGICIAFFQQIVFLLFIAIIYHTITLIYPFFGGLGLFVLIWCFSFAPDTHPYFEPGFLSPLYRILFSENILAQIVRIMGILVIYPLNIPILNRKSG
jgi:hypothetical protein